jgi:hypothetical protein
VTNPPDKIDAWLDADVEPLLPPPGTFERVSRRARQRKRHQLMMSAAAGVVVIAAAAAAPQLASALRHAAGSSGPPAAASQSQASKLTPRATGSASPASPSATPTSSPPGQSSWTIPTGLPVASGFRPTSITLVSASVAAVIGQARCASGPGLCTSLAATTTDGSGWYGWPTAPVAGPPSGSAGVSQLRYLNGQAGWAFGPALYVTIDGGASWSRETVPGSLRVIDLETAGNHAFALLASCAGRGSDYAADCSQFSLYSSAEGSTSWQAAGVPAGDRSMTGAAGQPGAASLVLASGTAANPNAGAGYLLTPSGALLSGDLTGGRWQAVGQIPRACQVGATQATGQPTGVQLATGSLAAAPQLALSCDGPAAAGGQQTKTIYISPDGAHWTQAGTAPRSGTARSLAASDGGLVILATSTGIDYSSDSGGSWSAAGISSPPAGGFSYVGMTTSADGVAVPADAALGEVFITTDGGQSWTASPVSG